MSAARKPTVAERLAYNIQCINSVARVLTPEQLADMTRRVERIAWRYCHPQAPAMPAVSTPAADDNEAGK